MSSFSCLKTYRQSLGHHGECPYLFHTVMMCILYYCSVLRIISLLQPRPAPRAFSTDVWQDCRSADNMDERYRPTTAAFSRLISTTCPTPTASRTPSATKSKAVRRGPSCAPTGSGPTVCRTASSTTASLTPPTPSSSASTSTISASRPSASPATSPPKRLIGIPSRGIGVMKTAGSGSSRAIGR